MSGQFQNDIDLFGTAKQGVIVCDDSSLVADSVLYRVKGRNLPNLLMSFWN